MNEHRPSAPPGAFVDELRASAKGLNCIYSVEKLLSDPQKDVSEILGGIAMIIPPAWQYPDACEVEIVYRDQSYRTAGFQDSQFKLTRKLYGLREPIGTITVVYREDRLNNIEQPFFDEERQLLKIIANRLVHYLRYRKLHVMFEESTEEETQQPTEWEVALQFLQRTEPDLLERITRKMINHLCLLGDVEARDLLAKISAGVDNEVLAESNQPQLKSLPASAAELAQTTFKLASKHLPDAELLARLQKGIYHDKANALFRPMTNVYSTLSEIAEALSRYRNLAHDKLELSGAGERSVIVNLLRRFFTEQLEFINVAKQFVRIEDFYHLIDTLIYPLSSRGKLGGKSAGLFLANRVLKGKSSEDKGLGDIKIPKTWYLASDAIVDFIKLNNLQEVYEQKYKPLDEVRQEYPHIVQVFKNSTFPKEIETGLMQALDDFGEVPLVVRSSSLLEDRFRASFSGKYKSLFIANQGTRAERLDALKDAISEVYASIFSPDPIEYRAERGLLDFEEQMGIMIQQVIGKRVGRYFFPSFAGVAFSNNELRWSSRIKRDDGLLRLVPGLGTRAVDRLVDDYPVLVSPGQPGLRVNVTQEETISYSPRCMDVIDVEDKKFKTLEVAALVKEIGDDYPALSQVVSVVKNGQLSVPSAMLTNFNEEQPVVTFEGLFTKSDFLKKTGLVLNTLKEALKTPVDLEFAVDGDNFYLLQCRPQSHQIDAVAAKIPTDVDAARILFNARKFVSNGSMPDLTHLVYVVPEAYAQIETKDEYLAVGETVGRLNKLLPKRKFALIGPGRWGSRGDIKLGVRVTYSDINNTAMLVEVARKKGQYLPDLSFGTHFFQDLVEASIRYLPLYPDDEGIIFNERFILDADNVLEELLPESAALREIVKVVDIPRSTNGQSLRVLMNADEDNALAYLVEN